MNGFKFLVIVSCLAAFSLSAGSDGVAASDFFFRTHCLSKVKKFTERENSLRLVTAAAIFACGGAAAGLLIARLVKKWRTMKKWQRAGLTLGGFAAIFAAVWGGRRVGAELIDNADYNYLFNAAHCETRDARGRNQWLLSDDFARDAGLMRGLVVHQRQRKYDNREAERSFFDRSHATDEQQRECLKRKRGELRSIWGEEVALMWEQNKEKILHRFGKEYQNEGDSIDMANKMLDDFGTMQEYLSLFPSPIDLPLVHAAFCNLFKKVFASLILEASALLEGGATNAAEVTMPTEIAASTATDKRDQKRDAEIDHLRQVSDRITILKRIMGILGESFKDSEEYKQSKYNELMSRFVPFNQRLTTLVDDRSGLPLWHNLDNFVESAFGSSE